MTTELIRRVEIKPYGTVPYETAIALPWHDSHIGDFVTSAGNYFRYRRDAGVRVNSHGTNWEFTIDRSDMICQVTDFGEWFATLRIDKYHRG